MGCRSPMMGPGTRLDKRNREIPKQGENQCDLGAGNGMRMGVEEAKTSRIWWLEILLRLKEYKKIV